MNLKELAVMLVVSIALLVLTNKIPPLMGNMAMGGGTGALGNGFGAGAALAAGGALGAAAAMGGTAIKSGAANIVGGTQALMAAYQNASSEAGSGSGVPAFLSNNTSSNSQGGPSTQTQASPLAKAMGIAANTGANLARGVSQVAQNKGAQIKESTQNRIDQTIGGQVATAIRGDKPSFDNNSLEGAKSDNGSVSNSAAI
jgi:type IV secretion system protein TrbL